MPVQWKVSSMERQLADGTVNVVHWRASLEEDGFFQDTYGSVSLTRDETSPPFVPYENLTESTVIEWVKEALGAENVTALEAGLVNAINLKKNPVSASGVPWN